MPGGKGKSIGGKAGSKDSAGKAQKSHSAKAGLQVSAFVILFIFQFFNSYSPYRDYPNARQSKAPEAAHLYAPPSFFSRKPMAGSLGSFWFTARHVLSSD